jgi:hypothetical protein
MIELFASIYEWFGLMLMYSVDMGEHLRGWDVTCTDYIGTPWYNIVGWIMIVSVLVTYILQYRIIDSPRFNRAINWWLYALALVLLNFIIALSISYNSIQPGMVCTDLNIDFADCVGFAFSNTTWSFVLYAIFTSISFVRNIGVNNRLTTFWKP